MARLGPAQAQAAREAAGESASDPNAPSEKSAEWFRDIMTRRRIPGKDGVSGAERAVTALKLIDDGVLTQRQVSKAIDEFKGCPLKASEEAPPGSVAAAADLVPSGHYAVKHPDGQLRFYRLKQGRKSGKFWIHVEHGPEETELWPNTAGMVMAMIMADPTEAARAYGRHIGCCSRCHIRLTNRISRLLDFGPVCGGHYYDPEIWKQLQRRAREACLRAGIDPNTDVEDTDDLDRIRSAARL